MVINYQIPVPIGDCSAHFLVQKKTDKVHRAFLMDGGTNAGTYVAWVQILKALRFIDLQLGNTWKFDSWVVTHWDADHYRGVKDLLLNEDIKFTRCNSDGKTVIRGSPGNFASLYFADDAWLCCGAWDKEAMFKGGNEFLRHFVNRDNLDSWSNLSMTIPAGTEGQSLLRCILGQQLIGLDLFTRSYQYVGATGKQYKYAFHPLEFEHRLESDRDVVDADNTPRFCVVGADGYGIGQSDRPKSTKPTRNKPASDDPTRNETSILALLYWKGQNLCSYYTGGDGNPAVFTGPVQTWFNKTWCNRDGTPLDVEMVKLDHHGSTKENLKGTQRTRDKGESNVEEEQQLSESESETKREEEKMPPADLEDIGLVIEDMSPRKVLVTPGSSHGHPTWDVMVFLRDYLERLPDASGNQSAVPQGLFTTRVPYWLIKGEVSLKDLNLKHSLGKGFRERKPSAAGDGSDKMVEEGKQVANEANRADSKYGAEDDDDGDSNFTIRDGIDMDIQHRRDGQTEFQKARKAYVNYISDKEKKGKTPQRDRKGNIKYKFWTGKEAKRKNYPALKKAVDKAIKDYREKYTEVCSDLLHPKTIGAPTLKGRISLTQAREKEAQEERADLIRFAHKDENSTRKGAHKEKKTGALKKALKDQSANSEDAIELDLLHELFQACNEMTETTDDAQLEGVGDFEAICWQPVTTTEAEDPHFLIRFKFGGQRQDTVVQVYDDSGRFEYVKKPAKVSEDSGQREGAKTDSQVRDDNDQDGEVVIVEQSEARPTKLLAEDDQNPWTKYAYGECAIVTMLSAESIETPVEPELGARAAKFYGKGGPKNMVFQYYSKRKAATEGIEELINLARSEEDKCNER
ncbi:hypothetical protein CCMA1212_008579 [Trichoderma ghanense]|uniref:Metallo-beta-lactamase domain-containing protein n=1 Tax=Trichoderma ghanense TaxID=65468 RepID=A0ABY2GWC8_9HYPO